MWPGCRLFLDVVICRHNTITTTNICSIFFSEWKFLIDSLDHYILSVGFFVHVFFFNQTDNFFGNSYLNTCSLRLNTFDHLYQNGIIIGESKLFSFVHRKRFYWKINKRKKEEREWQIVEQTDNNWGRERKRGTKQTKCIWVYKNLTYPARKAFVGLTNSISWFEKQGWKVRYGSPWHSVTMATNF